ncbi:unnamed protein product, partial [Mesorhabditis spiculigera]
MSILLWIIVFFDILIVNANKSCTAFLYQNITCADDVEILIAIDDANYTREEAQDDFIKNAKHVANTTVARWLDYFTLSATFLQSLSIAHESSKICGKKQDSCQRIVDEFGKFRTDAQRPGNIADFIHDILIWGGDQKHRNVILILFTTNNDPADFQTHALKEVSWMKALHVVNLRQDFPDLTDWRKPDGKVICSMGITQDSLMTALIDIICGKEVAEPFRCPLNNSSTASTASATASWTPLTSGTPEATTPERETTATTVQLLTTSTATFLTTSKTSTYNTTIPQQHTTSTTVESLTTTSTTILSTSSTSTTTEGPTGGPTPPPSPSKCSQNPRNLWLDVILLVEASDAVGNSTFIEIEALLKSAFEQLPLGLSRRNETRVAVAVYADTVKWMGQLGDYRSPIEFQFNRWQYLGTDGTDMEAAFRTANDEMDTSRFRRTNARSVILFAAENFRKQGDVDEFLEDVKTFKDNDGIIIVINFGQDHEYEALFRNISSGGFYMKFSNDWTSFIEQLNTLLCQANCFCPGQVELSGGTVFEPINGPYQRVPTFGCFWRSDLPALETLAEQACKGLGGAEHRTEMAIYREPEQMAWIRETHKDDPEATFAAMQLEHGKWIWFDGVEFNGEINVTNVNDIHATYGPIKGDTTNQAWGFATIGEKAGAKYVCQTRVCDAEFYCE